MSKSKLLSQDVRLDQTLQDDKSQNDMPWRFAAAAQEAERKRIARDLHDVLGQNIVALGIGLNSLKAKIKNSQDSLEAIRQLELLTAEMGDRVHYLTLELRPSSLDDLGLCASIEAYVEHWTPRFGIKADFHTTINEPVRLDALAASMAYRIVQEALTNVAKHSQATHVDVIIEVHLDQLIVVVEDNGRGFNLQSVLADCSPEAYLGIQGMIERASMAGGKLEIDSTGGVGTTVILRIQHGAGR